MYTLTKVAFIIKNNFLFENLFDDFGLSDFVRKSGLTLLRINPIKPQCPSPLRSDKIKKILNPESGPVRKLSENCQSGIRSGPANFRKIEIRNPLRSGKFG